MQSQFCEPGGQFRRKVRKLAEIFLFLDGGKQTVVQKAGKVVCKEWGGEGVFCEQGIEDGGRHLIRDDSG